MKFWKSSKKARIEEDKKNQGEHIPPNIQSGSNADSDPAMGLIIEGLELAKQGNYDESELRYYQVTAIDPNYSAVWYATSFSNYPNGLDGLLSKGFILGKPVDKRIEAYDAVLSIHPRNTRALMWKGSCLDYLGRYTEGLVCYREAIKINSRALWLLTNSIRIDFMRNRYEEAIFTIKAILRINPDDSFGLGIMGAALSALGRDEDAIVFFDKALVIEPNNALILCDKGTSMDNIRRIPEAFECFKRGLEIEPNNYCILTNMGVVLQEMGRYPEALASYDKALAISPSFANALYNKARLRSIQREFDDALLLLEKAIGSDPNCKRRAKATPEFNPLKLNGSFVRLVD